MPQPGVVHVAPTPAPPPSAPDGDSSPSKSTNKGTGASTSSIMCWEPCDAAAGGRAGSALALADPFAASSASEAKDAAPSSTAYPEPDADISAGARSASAASGLAVVPSSPKAFVHALGSLFKTAVFTGNRLFIHGHFGLYRISFGQVLDGQAGNHTEI